MNQKFATGHWKNACFRHAHLVQKLSFPLKISSVNVTKSAGNCGFGHIY